jgi:Rad3-related DNA helicase
MAFLLDWEDDETSSIFPVAKTVSEGKSSELLANLPAPEPFAPLPDVFTDEPLTITESAPKPDEKTLGGILRCFPFPGVREAQASAIEVIARTYDDPDKRFVIIEAPTGSGKSGIGMATAIWSAESEDGGAHYLTSQNSLSTQLVADFSKHGLVQLKGKANYQCNEISETCATASAMASRKKCCPGCPYRSDKNRYLNSSIGSSNYPYYMLETSSPYSELKPREFLILDEAHNIEKEVLGMVDITIVDTDCQRYELPDHLPRFSKDTPEVTRKWLDDVMKPALSLYIKTYENSERAMIIAFREKAMRLRDNIDLYLSSDAKEWVASSNEDGSLSIRPLIPADFAEQYLFRGSENIVMMSATILNFPAFRRSLGISKAESNSIVIPSDFPVKNRRLVYWPVGSMSAKTIRDTIPVSIERTVALLDKWKDKKGIIHTHTYKINATFAQALAKTHHGHRIITHDRTPESRNAAIAKHLSSLEPTVLMSPSMTEGLDLRGELSRFQIITKVPYPFLDDYTKARMELDPKWYQLQTAIPLVQATGRSVRDKDDYAVTIILDADFQRFLSQNQDTLPEWWLSAIEFR